MSAERLVKLWDGKRYLVDEVEAACPGLVAYATENESLKETVLAPESPRYRLTLLILLVVILGATALLRLNGAGWQGIVAANGILSLAFVLPMLHERWSRKRRFPRTVAVNNGTLSIETPVKRQEFPLAGCQWKWGDTREDCSFVIAGPTQPALELECADPENSIRQANVWVGVDEESRQRWHAFFILAGVPAVAKPKIILSTGMYISYMIAGGILGLMVGRLVGAFVALVGGNGVLNWWLAIVGTIVGAEFGALYVRNMYFRDDLMTTANRDNFYHGPAGGILIKPCVYSAFYAFYVAQNVSAGIIIVAVSVAIGWIVPYCFIRQKLRQQQRRAQSEPIPTVEKRMS